MLNRPVVAPWGIPLSSYLPRFPAKQWLLQTCFVFPLTRWKLAFKQIIIATIVSSVALLSPRTLIPVIHWLGLHLVWFVPTTMDLLLDGTRNLQASGSYTTWIELFIYFYITMAICISLIMIPTHFFTHQTSSRLYHILCLRIPTLHLLAQRLNYTTQPTQQHH
jgi:hypothetical protein